MPPLTICRASFNISFAVPKVFSWATLAARQELLGSGPGLTMIEVLPVVRLMELDADPLRR